MSEVTALGYVVAAASDLPAWEQFAQECLGLASAPPPGIEPSRDTLFLRLDERSWRLAIEAGDDRGVVALGFEVASYSDYQLLTERLQRAGIPVKEAPELAEQRGVLNLAQVHDPSGVPLELFCGATIEKKPFVSPTSA